MSYSPRYKMIRKPTREFAASLTRLIALLAPVCLLLLLATSPAALRADPLLTYPIRIGKHAIRAEVANTPESRRRGLMFRTRLASSSGMIFVFPHEQRISMWMKNTLIPLSVAFIDSDGRILNIATMQPNSEQTQSSKGPARFALEMNQGWFKDHGIESGARVTGLEQLPAPK